MMLYKNSAIFWGCVAIGSLLGLVSIRVHAQASQTAAKSAAPATEKPYDWKASFAKVPTGKVPRLPDGKPDLQGIWSFSILTPLERPGGVKNTDISAGEAEEAEDAAQKAEVDLRVEPTATPPGEKTTDAYNSFWRDGYWYKVPMTTLHTSQVVDPPDGHVPPITPEARQRRAEVNVRTNRPATGPEDRPTTSRCVTSVRAGPPIVGNGPGSQETTMQIIQSPNVVVVRQEALHASQMVYLDGRPRPPDSVHLDKGVSRGHWDGDVLVVDSTNFASWGVGNFAAYGTTDKLHVIERWKRLDDTHLLYGFTIEDPGTWTKPWSVEYVMWRLTNQEELVEYACNEGNVGIHFTLTAAREREKEEAAAKENARVAALTTPQPSAALHAVALPTSVPYSSNSLGMEFSMIPPGEFEMGCSVDAGENQCDKDEKPRHLVQITKPFEIARTEVTQKLWSSVMGLNPSAHKGDLQFPVEQISFQDVQAFLVKLNAQNDGYIYRLPTEAEWEYAARAGTTDQYAGMLEGDPGKGRRADGGAGSRSPEPLETRPVASKKPNAWGLYDTRGNVAEWIQDWYDPSYYSDSPEADPKGPAGGDLRVVRGESFRGYAGQYYPYLFRVSLRTKFPETYSFKELGFRVVREKR